MTLINNKILFDQFSYLQASFSVEHQAVSGRIIIKSKITRFQDCRWIKRRAATLELFRAAQVARSRLIAKP